MFDIIHLKENGILVSSCLASSIPIAKDSHVSRRMTVQYVFNMEHLKRNSILVSSCLSSSEVDYALERRRHFAHLVRQGPMADVAHILFKRVEQPELSVARIDVDDIVGRERCDQIG